MKTEPGWHFERLPKRGAPLCNDQLNTFEGHAFEREEDLLVREVLQNAIDAKQDDATKIRIVFRKVTLRVFALPHEKCYRARRLPHLRCYRRPGV
jgi:hypothetical protein